MSNSALVVACERNHSPGLVVLDHTIRKHNPTLACHKILFSNSIDAYRDWEVRRVDTSTYEKIPVKLQRFVPAWNKLEAFRMEDDFEAVVLMDCDILCLGSIKSLFSMGKSDLKGCPDIGVPGVKAYGDKRINSGVLSIGPRMRELGVWEELVEIAAKGESYDGGDQGAINEYLHRNQDVRVSLLHQKYNTLKRIFATQPALWDQIQKDIRLLHFVGDRKPWSSMKDMRFAELDALWHEAHAEAGPA